MTTYTAEQLAALEAAAAKGIQTVTSDGNTVVYRSLAEMHQQIAIMKRALASARVTHVNPSFSKGT